MIFSRGGVGSSVVRFSGALCKWIHIETGASKAKLDWVDPMSTQDVQALICNPYKPVILLRNSVSKAAEFFMLKTRQLWEKFKCALHIFFLKTEHRCWSSIETEQPKMTAWVHWKARAIQNKDRGLITTWDFLIFLQLGLNNYSENILVLICNFRVNDRNCITPNTCCHTSSPNKL